MYVKEIEAVLSNYPRRTSQHNPESYIGGGQSQLRYIGLRVPDLHKTLQVGFSFSTLDERKQIKIWDQIWWKSDCYEVMALALSWFYSSARQPYLAESWPILKKWAERIDNWAHSDTLSGIYARILENQPNLVYPVLEKWNSSKSPWIQRQSIVSLMYYSSQRKKILPFNKIIKLVEPLLNSEHYYVQKGIGWTLREAFNVYPDKTFLFITKNILKLSPHAFSAATEKMNQRQRGQLKQLRSNNKKKKKSRNLAN